MPDILRSPFRFTCERGLDLVNPIDRMPPGAYPYLFNIRVLEEGRLDSRPGYSPYLSLSAGDFPNSLRRLNDEDRSYAALGHTYVGGGGANLYAGPETSYTIVSGGFSGDPLSLIPFRPEQSPESWMYVFDRLKLQKVRPDGAVRAIGVAPPSPAPVIEYGPPAMAVLSDGDTGSWTTNGSGGSASPNVDRTNSTVPTIASLVYASGTTGWAAISPTIVSGSYFWAGPRMRVLLNSGGGNQETIAVREIHLPIPNTTISAIQYDSGSTGLCSMVLTGNPSGLERNSMLSLLGEAVRILEVNFDPSGITYSLRLSTTLAHAAGEVVGGLVSWFCFCANTHAPGESISAVYVGVTANSSGTSTTAKASLSIDAGTASGRPIDPANDYMHLSLFLQNPQDATDVVITLDIGDGTFTQNYWTYKVPASQFIENGAFTAGGDAWFELLVPLSTGVRTGSDLTRSFATIAALSVGVDYTATTAFGFTSWYLFGTYGEVILPGSPVGYSYESRFRDSSTGAASVPSPPTRYTLDPLREEVIVSPPVTSAAGVDFSDIYRLGGSISSFLYVGSCANTPGTSFSDTLPDSSVLSADQAPDLTLLQPFPLLTLPWTGQVNVTGTSVTYVSGTPFSPDLLSGSVILLNGQAFQTYGQPRSPSFLELSSSAGVLTNATFSIASPALAGQPLPFVFGPLEGPFLPVVFGLGDPVNAGTIYPSNPANLDAVGDQNSLEITGPSEPLISGACWRGLALCGSKDRIFGVQYSFLGGNGSAIQWQYQQIPSPSGMWSRWSCCSTPQGVAFLGRDGLYLATDSGAVKLTNIDGLDPLYPLFPHDGQPARPVLSGTNTIFPVDLTQLDYLRLVYADGDLLFSYLDTNGSSVTLRYELARRRWFLHHYADNIAFHYLVEGGVASPSSPTLLLADLNLPQVWISGGASDNGQPIDSILLTPSIDGGDERGQKLYVDQMIQADGTGILSVAAAYDNAQSFSSVENFTCSGQVAQFLQTLSNLPPLALHRNIGAKIFWTGGPAGPSLLAWEPSGYAQPYLSLRLTTQFFPMSFPGWKMTRRLYPALISNAPVQFTILCQDGRSFGPFSIPSTGGGYRIFPQMLPQQIKDLAFALMLDGGSTPFALFPEDFVCEVKEWSEPSYIRLAIFRA